MREWAINKWHSLVSIFYSFGGSFVVAELPEAIGTCLQQIVRMMRHLLSILYHSERWKREYNGNRNFYLTKNRYYSNSSSPVILDLLSCVVSTLLSLSSLHLLFFLHFPQTLEKINGILSSINSHICAIFEDLFIRYWARNTQFNLNTWWARECRAASFTICNIFSLMLIRESNLIKFFTVMSDGILLNSTSNSLFSELLLCTVQRLQV